MKRRLNDQVEASHNKYAMLEVEYKKLQRKFDEEKGRVKLDPDQQAVSDAEHGTRN